MRLCLWRTLLAHGRLCAGHGVISSCLGPWFVITLILIQEPSICNSWRDWLFRFVFALVFGFDGLFEYCGRALYCGFGVGFWTVADAATHAEARGPFRTEDDGATRSLSSTCVSTLFYVPDLKKTTTGLQLESWLRPKLVSVDGRSVLGGTYDDALMVVLKRGLLDSIRRLMCLSDVDLRSVDCSVSMFDREVFITLFGQDSLGLRIVCHCICGQSRHGDHIIRDFIEMYPAAYDREVCDVPADFTVFELLESPAASIEVCGGTTLEMSDVRRYSGSEAWKSVVSLHRPYADLQARLNCV